MENFDRDPDELLQPVQSSSFSSSSSSVTPTTESPNEDNKSRKRREKESKDRARGDVVLLNHMAPDCTDVAQAAASSPLSGRGGSESNDSDSEMESGNEQSFPKLPTPPIQCDVKSDLSNEYSFPTKPSENNGRAVETKEEYKHMDRDQSYRDRTSSINSSQGSVKSEVPFIKRERTYTDLSTDSLSLPFIQGSPEQKLKPLKNSAPLSRRLSSDLQPLVKLPSIHDMISSHVVPRLAEVNIPRCSTPVSLHDERSPPSNILSRRNTYSAQSPQDIQSHENRRHPQMARYPPPRLQSTSSGSTTTTTSGRSESTSTSTSLTESITPRSLPNPSDRPTNASSPLEQSPQEASFYNVPLGGYTCRFSGCTAAPFQTQYLLKNVHSSERPHYCPVIGCKRAEGGKGFKRKNEMIRHGLVHSSPGYVCPYCPDRSHTYPRPDNLQRHVSLHHKEKDKRDPSLRDVLAQRPPGMGSSSSRRRRP